MKIIKLESFDAVKLHCVVWDEVKEPRAAVQICHGMGENSRRYDRFARYLNDKGYIVFVNDQRAHGLTETDESRGHRDGFLFEDSLKDQLFIRDYLKKEYNLPNIFIGHSYGGILGQAFYQQDIDSIGIMLLGSTYVPRFLSGLARVFLKPLHIVAYKTKLRIVNIAADKFFSLKYKGDKGESQWISRDLVRRQDFIDSPLCNISLSTNFYYSLIKGVYQTNSKKNISKMKKDIPLALFSGTMDPIGGWGKKVTKLYKFYKKKGVKDITFKLYEGARHELINELNYKEVFEDINSFIEKCLQQQ